MRASNQSVEISRRCSDLVDSHNAIVTSEIGEQIRNRKIKACASEGDIRVIINDPSTDLELGCVSVDHHQPTVRSSRIQVSDQFMTQQTVSNREYKRCKQAAGSVMSGRSQQTPNCTKEQGGGDYICTECGKGFRSWKALFGHMRCHPEREWRGINPPTLDAERRNRLKTSNQMIYGSRPANLDRRNVLVKSESYNNLIRNVGFDRHDRCMISQDISVNNDDGMAARSRIWKSEAGNYKAFPAPLISEALLVREARSGVPRSRTDMEKQEQDTTHTLYYKDASFPATGSCEAGQKSISATNSSLEIAKAHHGTSVDTSAEKNHERSGRKFMLLSAAEAGDHEHRHAKDGVDRYCFTIRRDGVRWRDEEEGVLDSYGQQLVNQWRGPEDQVQTLEEGEESETESDGSSGMDDNGRMYESSDKEVPFSTTAMVIRGKRSRRRSNMKPLRNVGKSLDSAAVSPGIRTATTRLLVDDHRIENPPTFPATDNTEEQDASLLQIGAALESETNLGSSVLPRLAEADETNLVGSSMPQMAGALKHTQMMTLEGRRGAAESSEELEMAHCLVMLAGCSPITDTNRPLDSHSYHHHHHQKLQQAQSNIINPASKNDNDLQLSENPGPVSNYSVIRMASDAATDSRGSAKFECATCSRTFKSRQALGGHRASHKKIKGCFAKTWGGDSMVPPNINVATMLALGSSSSNNNKRQQLYQPHQHRCSICLRVFPSGQALGGHKRCHWTIVDKGTSVGTGHTPTFSSCSTKSHRAICHPAGAASSKDAQPAIISSSPYQLQLLDLNLPLPFSSNDADSPPHSPPAVDVSIGCLLSLGTPLHHVAGLPINPERKEEQAIMSLAIPCIPA